MEVAGAVSLGDRMSILDALSPVGEIAPVSSARRWRSKRSAGTTLIEILVVIVLFLVGILAVAQIFPKGFQLLLWNRSKLVAQSLAEDYLETLKARPDRLPQQIVSAYYDQDGTLIINPAKDPNDLSTLAASVSLNGEGTDANGINLNNWQYITASNVFRHIIGEGGRVPAPRLAGTGVPFYGGIMVLQFGPVQYLPQISGNVDNPSNLTVYGNDLQQIVGTTAYATYQSNGQNYVGFPPIEFQRTDYQYFVANGAANLASYPTAIFLPTGPLNPADDQYYASGIPHRDYRVSFSAYVLSGANGQLVKHDYTGLAVSVADTTPDASGQYPLSPPVNLQALVNSYSAYSGDQIVNVDLNTLTVQRFFLPIPKGSGTQFSTDDPYQYKLINENLGVLLFNPLGNGIFVSRQGHDREPLSARVDYDVYDWRILHDDFRIDPSVIPGETLPTSPQTLIAQHKLPVPSLKVAGHAGPDNLPITPIPILELPVPTTGPANGVPPLAAPGTTDTSAANQPGPDNFVLVDMDTGGVFYKVDPTSGEQLITVNKSTGVVTFNSLSNSLTGGIIGELLLPDGSVSDVQMDNRAVRALYMVNQEYSVQVMKAAAQYSMLFSPANLGVGQFYIGGTPQPGTGVPGAGSSWRIYFPQCDNGRKVTVGDVTYLSSADTLVHDMVGQDFLIQNRINDPLGLPSIDLTQVDPNATSVSFLNGIGARDIKGDSVAVRVLWNPTTFHLTGNATTNLNNLINFGSNWRIMTDESFLQQEDNNR